MRATNAIVRNREALGLAQRSFGRIEVGVNFGGRCATANHDGEAEHDGEKDVGTVGDAVSVELAELNRSFEGGGESVS